MYDPFAQGVIEDIPDLDDLTADDTQRSLSRAYFALTDLRLDEHREVPEELSENILFLRRLANALESRAVFDADVEAEERRASAFVAAEALAFLADIREFLDVAPIVEGARVEQESVFSRTEAALLYIIAGYDANAGSVIRDIPSETIQPEGNIFKKAEFYVTEWVLDVLISFCTFHLNPLPSRTCPIDFVDGTPTSLIDLERDTRARLYAMLGESVRAYMGWLTGESRTGLMTAREQLNWLASGLANTQRPLYADIHHLARLLKVVLDETEERVLVHGVRPPDQENAEEYLAYLMARSEGVEGDSGRPLLWPSVQEYVDECLPGPSRHAVVSMPTGSGKSFLAELAVSQALLSGWVLYLVPTNALAHQVRRDLRQGLDSLDVEVRAFIGDGEYTTLQGERVEDISSRTIVAMTPEKCSLSMRLNPEAFETCQLCVFDECQLIGQNRRGVVAELVLSQLMMLAPSCRYLLMSAIIQNPQDLSEWLNQATGEDSQPVTLNWRPTRSLRCAVGVDAEVVHNRELQARERLEARSDYFKNEKFEANFAVLAGLQGAWQTTSQEIDYAVTRLPKEALLRVHREEYDGEWIYETQASNSWVNESSRRLGEMLAEARIPTLIFLPASKHYPFSVGDDISLSEELQAVTPAPSERVRAFLALAEDELGLPSKVANLIERGVSVHTAALLETEKFASEEAFRDGTSVVILATPTLAQGLNLPAIAVVIGGTRIGHSPREDPEVLEQRRLSQLINASGRAGRAGFANQGLVLAISDSMLLIEGPQEASDAVEEVRFLAHADASVEILSPLRPFMDSIATGRFDVETASDQELLAVATLAGDGPETGSTTDILHRTYAAYLRRQENLDAGAEIGAERLAQVRSEFIAESGAPDWLPKTAQRAGLKFFSILRLFQAWSRVMPEISNDMFEWDIEIWTTIYFQTLRYLTPKQVRDVFGSRSLERFMPGMHELVTLALRDGGDDPLWTPSEQWIAEWEQVEELVTLWMTGAPIRDIASVLLDLDLKEISPERNHVAEIPKALAFIHKIIDRHLSLLAGGLVALVDEELAAKREAGEDWPANPPFELSALPLAIKYGCDSLQTIGWYRFGFRFRRPAHLFARAFPLDPTIRDDDDLRDAVWDLRQKWLGGEIIVPGHLRRDYGTIFDSIKTIRPALS